MPASKLTSRRRAALGALVAMLCAPALGHAAEWRLQAEESALVFRYMEDGAPKTGFFEVFEADARFDPAAPREAALDLRIEVDSIELNDFWREEFVKTKVWFDSRAHPTARFRLVGLRPSGADGYVASGDLTIKGRTKRVEIPTTLEIQERTARARGVISFDRFDFQVGDRSADVFVVVGDQVEVSFDLAAERVD